MNAGITGVLNSPFMSFSFCWDTLWDGAGCFHTVHFSQGHTPGNWLLLWWSSLFHSLLSIVLQKGWRLTPKRNEVTYVSQVEDRRKERGDRMMPLLFTSVLALKSYFPLKSALFLNFMCVDVLPHICLCTHTCVQCHWRPEAGVRSSGSGVTGGYEPPCGSWNPGSLNCWAIFPLPYFYFKVRFQSGLSGHSFPPHPDTHFPLPSYPMFLSF